MRAWIAVAALILGCGSPERAHVWVEIWADLSLRTDLDDLHILVRATAPEGTPEDFRIPLSPSTPWPVRLSLVPRGGDPSRRYEVIVEGHGARAGDSLGPLLVRQGVQSGYQSNESRRVPIHLQAACREVTCTGTLLCSSGMCAPTLYLPPAVATDTPSDAFSGTDAGLDAASADAWVPADARRTGLPVNTLSASCGVTLSGRAIVSFSTTLGVAFTTPTGSALIGSLAFDFVPSFEGAVPNPEGWIDGQPRRLVSLTTGEARLFGSHCWPAGTSLREGSATITRFSPSSGVIRVQFVEFPLHSCSGPPTECTVTGELATSGLGVFE